MKVNEFRDPDRLVSENTTEQLMSQLRTKVLCTPHIGGVYVGQDKRELWGTIHKQ